MKFFNRKLLACLMAVCMLVTLMPFAMAEGVSYPEITTEYQLQQAALAGGTYRVTEIIDVVDGSIEVEKDLTLYLEKDIQLLNLDPEKQIDALFVVNGATLTIEDPYNGTLACISYCGAGCAVKLIGAETQSALISNTGCWYGFNRFMNEQVITPVSLFYIEHAEGTIQPKIFLNNASYSVQSPSASWDGPLFAGAEPDLTIRSGVFKQDVSDYVEEGYVCLPNFGEYNVQPLAEEFSEEFTLTGNDGILTLNRYEPETEDDLWMLVDMLYTYYGFPENVRTYEFFQDSYDFENHTLYIARTNEDGAILEVHLIALQFDCDPAIKEQVDAVIDTLPEGTYIEEDWYVPYYFAVSDLELFNYWMTCNESNDWFNVNNLINYSTEFKELIDYRNYCLDIRMGDGDFFYTMAEGIADFKYNGTVYAATQMGVRADHILYVPDETEDTAEAMLAAVQKRLDDYLGAGVVAVEAMTEEDRQEIGYEGYGFRTVINDWTYHFLAVRDSSKMVTPSYKSVDVSTEVAVLTEDASVPLDTMVEVETLTEGEDYDRIMAALNVEEHETYNIKLYSGSKEDYVTALESGEFEVQIPVSEQLEGKELIAYYVDAEGTVTEHEVTVEEGVASFATDHFSAYTLAAKKTSAPCDHAFAWDEESKSYLCSACGTAYEQTLDLDGDGSPTTADAIMLLRYIDGHDNGLNDTLADINMDGKVRIFDAIRFLQLMNA